MGKVKDYNFCGSIKFHSFASISELLSKVSHEKRSFKVSCGTKKVKLTLGEEEFMRFDSLVLRAIDFY
jgi:hypothetical protein